MFTGLLGNLFWVAIGMALMFGLWFGALTLWKGLKTAGQYTSNVWGGAAKAVEADIATIKSDVAAIKAATVPPKVAPVAPVVAPPAPAVAHPVGGIL
jgi:hypothetical protein